MTVGGMGFIPERLLMMMMMITASPNNQTRQNLETKTTAALWSEFLFTYLHSRIQKHKVAAATVIHFAHYRRRLLLSLCYSRT